MKVTVRLFATFREVAGTSSSEAEVSHDATVAQVWDSVADTYPRLKPFAGISAFAVNGEYAPASTRLEDGDEVAFIPPVSGG